MTELATDLTRLFAAEGPFATAIPEFRSRPMQQAMAERITEAIEQAGILVIEAGTGTGKTLAYLVPALLAGGKVLLSTASKTLQDQLFQRDLPAVRAVLQRPVSTALLKGRANYVCHLHLARALDSGRFHAPGEVRDLKKIAQFAARSDSGDRMACQSVGEESAAWPYAVSTRDNCLGSECPHVRDCFVLKARKKALEADVVVINHHLFFADVWLKDEGAGELLPNANVVIFDEAHQLPDIASLFFGERLSTGQLLDLCRDVREAAAIGAADYAPLPKAAHTLEKALRDTRLAFTAATPGGRLPIERVNAPGRLALETVTPLISDLRHQIETQAMRSEELEQLANRCGDAEQHWQRWLANGGEAASEAGEQVRWLEITAYGVTLHATPLDVGSEFAQRLKSDNTQERAWIFTSATLSVRGNFAHYLSQIGVPEAQTAVWDSPYDYERQALLYVPAQMPEANTPGYTMAVLERAWPVLHASQGRAFLLFTSLRALQEAKVLLTQRLAEAGLDWPLLVQGDDSRSALLARFRSEDHAILLGSQSFWEGVDVAGEALSLVVIDKLPFQPPDDPVLAARIEQLRQAGGNPFFEIQLPQAVINLKQGAGRLIRRETDRGVLMICDTRLVDKPYGKRIWQSLPPMRRSRIEAEAVTFFAQTSGQKNAEEDLSTD
jgi:ATP-dependent DNA helicase DinG